VFTGNGTFSCAAGTYVGGFSSGKKSGGGKLTLVSGEVYEGGWENDLKNGS